MQPDSERRRFRRYAVERKVALRISDWSILAQMHNVSVGGLRLRLPVSAVPGDRFVVELTLPNGLRLSPTAEVCRVDPPDDSGTCAVGVRWVETSADDDQLLEALVAEIASDVSRPS